jgi:ethanolamine utilization microcompartment shell protein EutS
MLRLLIKWVEPRQASRAHADLAVKSGNDRIGFCSLFRTPLWES